MAEPSQCLSPHPSTSLLRGGKAMAEPLRWPPPTLVTSAPLFCAGDAMAEPSHQHSRHTLLHICLSFELAKLWLSLRDEPESSPFTSTFLFPCCTRPWLSLRGGIPSTPCCMLSPFRVGKAMAEPSRLPSLFTYGFHVAALAKLWLNLCDEHHSLPRLPGPRSWNWIGAAYH